MALLGLAFTMAEILLSLTIIGVVAAITLPSLTGNINERTWNTQRKALYARFSQAIALMPALNGYGTLDSTTDTAAETFVTEGLSKVFKINNICDNEHLEDCGIPTSFTDLSGNLVASFPDTLKKFNEQMVSVSFVGSGWGSNGSDLVYNYNDSDKKAAAFETANGESIVVYYNPNCTSYTETITTYYIQPNMCANFIYDLNGNKGPNTVGKDIGFITALYPSDPVVVAPMPLIRDSADVKHTDINKTCMNQDSESRIPNINELAALYYNKTLIGINSKTYWSGSVLSSGENGQAWGVSFNAGYAYPDTRSKAHPLRCIKR